jgi:hypothetical protein
MGRKADAFLQALTTRVVKGSDTPWSVALCHNRVRMLLVALRATDLCLYGDRDPYKAKYPGAWMLDDVEGLGGAIICEMAAAEGMLV